jgi:hypothetical protein
MLKGGNSVASKAHIQLYFSSEYQICALSLSPKDNIRTITCNRTERLHIERAKLALHELTCIVKAVSRSKIALEEQQELRCS